jgi:hypothetical protein
LSDLNLKRRDPLPDQCRASKHVTRQETQSKRVRVLDHHRVPDLQVERARERRRRGNRTCYKAALHEWHPDMCSMISISGRY